MRMSNEPEQSGDNNSFNVPAILTVTTKTADYAVILRYLLIGSLQEDK